ncbi:MAG: aldo/keto reductase [Tissierellaceae bacterium]|jgi:predicted aldo/keto reductase-like oxidoreductase|nr:aldo/keto reductase [Tissierellia bacterium]
MQYRKFTRDNLDVSLLGFGCMRFPVLNDDPAQIDEEKASEMLKLAIENGVNYIDTAYNYHDGNSESFLGSFLHDGYREKIYLATKLPVWLVKSYEDFEKYLDEQLEKLKTDYIDFYLLHALHKKTWTRSKELNVFKFLDQAKAKGKIRYAGFSFHDELPLFREIIDSYPWDFCQIQLNYMDIQYQAGVEGLKYAAEKGISLAIMEPIKGGKLASAPKDIQAIWDQAVEKRSPAEWALKWVYDFEEVAVVLSGMSTLDQVKENLALTKNSLAKSLTEDEHRLIQRVIDLYKQKIKVGCTSCNYCLPCPQGVAIPGIFSRYNDYYVFGDKKRSRFVYNKYKNEGKDSSQCIECGECEQLCPQQLRIISHLKDADRVLSK